MLAALERLEGAPGRLQRVGAGPRGGEAYVDYAHTPDGLQTVLTALRPHAERAADRGVRRRRRPRPGQAAADGGHRRATCADIAIVTDDNPRSEEPAAIRAAGAGRRRGRCREIGDRREAIRRGAALLEAGDILVVAGKGHEQGQIIGDQTIPFDDVAETAGPSGSSNGWPEMAARPDRPRARCGRPTRSWPPRDGRQEGAAFTAAGRQHRQPRPGARRPLRRPGRGAGRPRVRPGGAGQGRGGEPGHPACRGPAVVVADTLQGLRRWARRRASAPAGRGGGR